MDNIRLLEDSYLKAKIAYYEGTPIMTDAEFDALETHLKSLGSKAPEQVGAKRKDFDFSHPTKMLSLAKLQTEATENGTDYKEEDFRKWANKNKTLLGLMTELEASPKFDGNAINIIYQGTKLVNILTRGDGFTGKDITKRMTQHVPSELLLLGLDVQDTDTVEIRAEVVIDIHLFNEKYASEFANARNYVAGVIGKDDADEVKVSELKVIPLHFLVNGKHVARNHFSRNTFCSFNWNSIFIPDNYVQTIQTFEKLRETIHYQLDGVVISFPAHVRELLGENDHDPEWAIAIKFVPVETITEVEGIEWNISKRGEIIPTLLLKPVLLDGSTVRRASGYNAGYLFNKVIGPGALVSIAKAGDIIPEVQKVVVKSPFHIPNLLPPNCPACGSLTEFNDVHIICPNPDCVGRIAKQLAGAVKILELRGIGEKTIEPFAQDFKNMYELIRWARTEGETISGNIGKYGIAYGSRSHEIFTNAFKNIKSLSYVQVIQMLGYDNVGEKLSVQLSREHAGLEYNYMHLEKALVAKLRSPEVSGYIKEVVKGLEDLGISIDRPKGETADGTSVGVCLTGSPKDFGYATKAEFLAKFPNVKEVSLTDSSCKYLVTDSYQSTSSKMKTAEKKGIKILTYGDFKI